MQSLNEMQASALKELGNIGVSTVATAVSELLNKTVSISLPRLKIYPQELPDILEESRPILASAYVNIDGDIKAKGLMLFAPEAAIIFESSLAQADPDVKKMLSDEDKISVFREFTTIIASSYISSLSMMLGLIGTLQDTAVDLGNNGQSPREFIKGKVGEKNILSIETDFTCQTILGNITLLLDEPMVGKILNVMGVA